MTDAEQLMSGPPAGHGDLLVTRRAKRCANDYVLRPYAALSAGDDL